jgi:hypothetical protein
MSVKLPECAFVALDIQHVMRMCHISIRCLQGFTILFHLIEKKGTIFERKKSHYT